MVWWILLGGLVVGLLMLALAVRPLVARRGTLQRALVGLQRRAAEAEELQARVEALQARIASTDSPQKLHL